MGRLAVLSMFVLLPQDPPAPAAFPESIDAAVKSIPGWPPRVEPVRMGDLEFLHRVTDDLTGQAPKDEVVRTFPADPAPAKRERLVEELLASPAFGRFWGRRLAEAFIGDLSKVRMEGIGGVTPETARKIVDRYVNWLAEQLNQDRPYTEIVQAMIEARGKADETPALGYKLAHFRGGGFPGEFAMGLSRGLLGIRLYCARCHDHPYDRWTVENYYGVGAFVAREKVAPAFGADPVELKLAATGEMEIPREPWANDKDAKVKAAQGGTADPVFLFGGAAKRDDDRTKVLAGLVTGKANTQLPRALVNRVWGWIFRRGIVHPVDDFNLRNKAISPALLDRLTRGFVDGGHSLKTLLRAICRTNIYQVADAKGAAEEDAFYLRGIYRKGFTALSIPKDAPKLAAPEAWKPYLGPMRRPWPMARIPDKKGKAADALLSLARSSSWGDEIVRQLVPAKPKTETIEGKQPVALTEVTGKYWCDTTAGAPLENHHVIVARVGKPGGWTFRLEGPAETVGDWRDEFVEMLKKIDP